MAHQQDRVAPCFLYLVYNVLTTSLISFLNVLNTFFKKPTNCVFDLKHYPVRDEKVEILTMQRAVDPTEDAVAKAAAKGEASAKLESVFSASVLPVEFFQDLIRGNSAKGLFLGFVSMV